MQTLFLQGPSVTLRMIILVIISVVLMTVDHRWKHLEVVRSTLNNLLYPLQYTIDLPIRLYYWADETVSTHQTLLDKNRELENQHLQSRVQLQKLDILEKENIRLRELLSATPKIGEEVLIAEIIKVDVDPYRQLIVINKGTTDGVFKGQSLIDAQGVVGQVFYTSPFSSTVMLISDASHAIPVQVDRTGLRTVAFGTGIIDHLNLRHIPQNADIQKGDKLITSGLGGHFPPNYPVAIVNKVERSVGEAFASVHAKPLALLDQNREALLVWHSRTVKSDIETDPDSQTEKPAEATPINALESANETE